MYAAADLLLTLYAAAAASFAMPLRKMPPLVVAASFFSPPPPLPILRLPTYRCLFRAAPLLMFFSRRCCHAYYMRHDIYAFAAHARFTRYRLFDAATPS